MDLTEQNNKMPRTTRIQPPGGVDHITCEVLSPEVEGPTMVNSSRVLRPPGGASSIFGGDSTASSSAESSPKPKRIINYKMASNFELGDEQPTPAEQQQMKDRRRSKPSVNPLTGELIGASYGSSETGGSRDDLQASRESSPGATPTKSGRVPPGGYSSPLW